MAVRSPRILSICTGAGGLDLGVRLARPDARTVCYVEREAFAVANLVAAIQGGLMDEAPVWSDLATFDGGPWRGRVDWLIGGIPCQPHSTAGQRHGADDERDLWPDAARIIREVRPGIVFLENVPGIMGYYHERIGPELRGMGYRTEEGLFSAAEVGAPHARERFFVLGYANQPRRKGERMFAGWPAQQGAGIGQGRAELADAEHWPPERRGREMAGPPGVGEGEAREQRLWADAGNGGKRVADTEGDGRAERRQPNERQPTSGSEAVANAHNGARSPEHEHEHEERAREFGGSGAGVVADGDRQHGNLHLREGQPGDAEPEAQRRGEEVADAPRDERGQSPEAARKRERQPAECGEGLADDHGQRQRRDVPPWARGPEALRSGQEMDDAAEPRPQGRVSREYPDGRLSQPTGPAFPPGPDEFESWARVLAEMPEVEPAFCREADGVAWWLDATANRTQRLRVLGNGVVPLVAAHAFRTLGARMGLELGSLKEAI